jgi:tetratricopeptide (TPR) repeat protein
VEDACRTAYDRANEETSSTTETRDKFFAWFNAGTSLVCLEDYSAAAAAYDTAFSIYPEIIQADRPFRILWYEISPYAAYYNSGRYQDVIDLADQTLNNMGEPLLEESYYWKALSYIALGDTDKAISNLKTSLKCHPGYEPSVIMLEKLGVTP